MIVVENFKLNCGVRLCG